MSGKKLRLALLSVHSSPLEQPGTGDTGGMSIYIRELSLALASQGHMVDIYTRVQDTITPQIIELAPQVRQIHIQAGEPADIDKLLVYSCAPDFACKTENFRQQHNLKYDLIFSHYWISGIAGEYLQTWWQVPQLMMFHTLGVLKNAIGIGEDEPELRIEEERQVARNCRHIIASTETEKIALNRYYSITPEKISTIPCGVNLNLFRPVKRAAARSRLGWSRGKILLFVGRIERMKGIEKIIQTLPLLTGIKPRLIIAGEDGNRPGEIERLTALAEKLGVKELVTFTGLVDYEKLPDYYNAADICVFPSYYESFGLVPLESLACGTPVIATDVGDLKNIIREGKTGYVINDNQPQGLAEKIEDILRGKARLEDAEAIRSSIIHLGWGNIAEMVALECNKVITEKRVMMQTTQN